MEGSSRGCRKKTERVMDGMKPKISLATSPVTVSAVSEFDSPPTLISSSLAIKLKRRWRRVEREMRLMASRAEQILAH